ncbi:MAG TPA: hypothetical protein VEF37_04305 [Thermodesulfovibrionales bacterium]|nr:hypothetical protein [Thermodesulfovibrionales bacterium]
MLCFLLGLVVGGILGIAVTAILSAGATADKEIEHTWRNFNQLEKERNSVILKH